MTCAMSIAMSIKQLLSIGLAVTSVTAMPFPVSAPETIQTLHLECTTGDCSPADIAKFTAIVDAIKHHRPDTLSYNVTSKIERIYDGDKAKPQAPKDDTVSIQKRQSIPTAVPDPIPVGPGPVLPAPGAKPDAQISEATKSQVIAQAEQILVQCSSAEGGCTQEQIAEVEESVRAAGWGFLKPILDLIGKFKFTYGIEVGDKTVGKADSASDAA